MKSISVIFIVAKYPATYGHTSVINNLCHGLNELGHKTAIGAFSFDIDPPKGVEKVILKKNELLRSGVASLEYDIIHPHQAQVLYYLLFKKEDLRVELGKNRPAIALKRKIEGYPLIGTAYWKGRQYHIDISNNYSIFEYGASFALKRPLSYDDAVEDKSFRMLVYGDTEKIDGQTYEIGLRGGLKFRALRLQSWFYTGKLIDDEDWKKRLHYDFDYYANLEPDNVLSKDANIDHSWYGARGELDIFNTLLRGEFIGSIDGYLKRQGYYGEVSSNLRNNLLILLRYGELRIDPGGNDFFPQLKDPQTWDRKLLTLASVYDITSYAKLKVEYYLLDEVTGDRDEDAKTERRDYQPNVKDNQLLIQFELNY